MLFRVETIEFGMNLRRKVGTHSKLFYTTESVLVADQWSQFVPWILIEKGGLLFPCYQVDTVWCEYDAQ